MKENDLLLNILANPHMSIEDFQKVGLSIENTSLEDENVYKNSPLVTENPIFQDENGNFDENKLHQAHIGASYALQELASKPQDYKAVYSKYNIFAPNDQINWDGDKPKLVKVSNPDRITKSMITLGRDGTREYTPAEIAQSQRVWNSEKQEWMDTPEDMFSFGKLFSDIGGFFSDNFDSTKVLATYDTDVDISGKKRGEIGFDENAIAHTAGEYMLNDNGTYFYRTLKKGENVYGKQILHYSDILTREGSALNAIDFLDSDDIKKSPMGAFIKNASLVGSFFLPYVGTAIAGATILQQAAELGSTLGKIALGSDNETMNWIEGLAKSTNPIETRSEWSTLDYGNTGRNVSWTTENLLGMIGDVVAQLYQQRMLFKYLPVVTKGKWGISEKGQEALKAKYVADIEKSKTAALDKLNKAVTTATSAEEKAIAKRALAKAQTEIKLIADDEAAQLLESYMKSYYKSGEVLSKAYMTLLTVNDIYGEAKQAGATDFDAALVTTVYAAMEYALLSTDIGKWVLPELRAERLRNRAIFNALTSDVKENFAKLNKEALTSDQAKESYFREIFNFTKKIFKTEFNAGLGKRAAFQNGKGLLKAGAASIFAGGLAEGVEETSEELLGDFSRAIFNGLQTLKGNKDVRLKPFENAFDRYALSFLGGMAGGGIASATFDFSNVRQSVNMTYDQAMQEIVYKARNKELDGMYKLLDTETVGNPNLSAKEIIETEDGQRVWKQGTVDDNQDKAIKAAVRTQLDLIQKTLDAHGGNLTDSEFLDINTLRNLRYRVLQNTTTAGRFLQHYNELLVELYQNVSELNKLKSPEVRAESGETDGTEPDPDLEKSRKKYEDRIKEIDKELEDLTSGKMAPLFMTSALLESTPYILQPFMTSSFRFYAENATKTKFENIPQEEKEHLMLEYQNYLKTTKKDDVARASGEYIKMQNLIKENLDESVEVIKSIDPEIASLLGKLQLDFNILNSSAFESEEWKDLVEQQIKSGAISEETRNILTLINNSYVELNNQLLKLEVERNQEGESFDDDELINRQIEIDSQVEAINNAKEQLFNQAQEVLNKGQVNQILTQADKIIESGYINGAVKDRILGNLKQVEQFISQFQTTTEADMSSFLTQIQEKSKQIEELSYTPIMENLDKFALTIGGTRVSQLLDSIGKQFVDANIQGFTLAGDQYKALNEALRVIDLYISALEGARTDNVDPFRWRMNPETQEPENTSDVWGINKVLNDVHKASPKIENDPWVDLPEIEGYIADMMILDAKSIKSKLKIYQKLYNINQGQKLNAQDRVSNRAIYSIYGRLMRLLNNTEVPFMEGIDSSNLLATLNKLTHLSEFSEKGLLELNPTQQIELEKERLQMEDAIYNFFNVDNPDLLNNQELLIGFFSPKKFKLWSSDVKLLTENSEEIDDSSFLGYLISKAVLKSSDFYGKFKEIIKGSEKAPIISQEIAVALQLANILQGDKVSALINAYRQSMIKYFLSLNFEERVKLLTEASGRSEANISDYVFSTDEGIKYIQNYDLIPQFTNISFIDGIPGAGKTEGVDNLVIKFLQTYYPDFFKEKKVWVCHGGDKTGIESKTLRQKIGLDENTADILEKEKLLKTISIDYKLPVQGKLDQNDYLILNGQIIPKWKLNEVSELPSLIIIDEAQQFTQLELLLIDKFARENGISVIMSGDIDQSQQYAYFEFEGVSKERIIQELKGRNIDIKNQQLKFRLTLTRNQVLHSFKLGFSMRSNNNQKSTNVNAIRVAKETDASEIVLHYYEDENIITGDRVMTQVEDVYPVLDKMIKNLKPGEKITYAYDSSDTDLYKALQANKKYSDYIEFVQGTALGREGDYWIVEVYNFYKSKETYLQDLYTASSRARIASIDFGPSASGIQLFEQADSETHPEELPIAGIKRYAERRVKRLNEVISTFGDIEYIPRTKHGTLSSANPNEIRRQEEEQKRKYEEELERRRQEEEDRQDRLRREEEERVAREVEKRNTRINAVKDQSEFILPEDVTYSQLSDGTYVLSEFIPVSQEWMQKYGTNPYPPEIAYVKEISTNFVDLYDEKGNSLGRLYLNGLFGEIFNNQIISSDSSEDGEMRKLDQFRKAINSAKIYVNSDTFTYGINDAGNLLVETPEFSFDNYILFRLLSDDKLKEQLDVRLSPIVVSAIEYDNNLIKLYTDKDTISLSLDDFLILFGNIIDIEWTPETNQEIQISEFDVSNVTETQQKLDEAALEDDKQEKSPTVPPTNTDLENFFYYLFSNATFEYGTTEIDRINNTYERSPIEHRIDSLNGIFNLAELNPRLPAGKLKESIELLGRLRKYLMHTSDKAKLESYISALLGISNIYVRYAIKTSQFDNHYESHTQYSKLEKDPNEPSNGRAQIDGQSRTVNNRSLVAIIGSGERDLIELPLLTFNNPATILQIRDSNGELRYPIGQIYIDSYRKYIAGNMTRGEAHVAALNDVLVVIKNNPEYDGLTDLITLYLRTDRNIIFIKDQAWTIEGNLTSYGPQLHFDRGAFYEVNEDYIQESEVNEQPWITLDELRQDKSIMVSNILHYVGETKVITTETGNEIQVVSHTKHPLVLFTDYLWSHTGEFLRSDKDLVEEFLFQKAHPDELQTIKLLYVLPPTFTLKEYIQSLIDFTVNHQGRPLGNQRTAYKILESLLYDQNGNKNQEFEELFKTAFGDNMGEDIFFKVLKVLESLKDLPIEEQIKQLTSRQDSWDFGILSLSNRSASGYQLLQNVLKQLVYPMSIGIDGSISYVGNNRILASQLAIMEDLFERSGNSLFYQTLTDKDAAKYSGLFAPIQLVTDYRIKDKNFTVNGNISSSTFSVNKQFNRIIHNALYDGTQHNFAEGSNTLLSWDNQPYTNGYSGFRTRVPKNPTLHSSIIEKLKKFGLTTSIKPTTFEDKSLETLWKVADEINAKKSKYKALVFFNELFITENDFFEGKNVEFIFDSNPTENGVNYQFDVRIEGEEYDATFSSTTQGNILAITQKNGEQITQQSLLTPEKLSKIQGQVENLQSRIKSPLQRFLQSLKNVSLEEIPNKFNTTPLIKNLFREAGIDLDFLENTQEVCSPTLTFTFI